MKDDYPFPDKCEKCIHENVCYMVGECTNHIPDFECDCFEEKRPDATFRLYRDDMFSGGCYIQCTSCERKFSGGAYKILEHDNYCPHCGAKIKRPKEPDGITLTFNVDKIEKIEIPCPCDTCQTEIDRCGCQMHLCSDYKKWKEGDQNETSD